MTLPKSERIKRNELYDRGLMHCPCCEKDLPLKDFSSNKNRRYGINSYCKSCARDSHVKHTYKLSTQQYKDLKSQQGGKCAICKNSCSTHGRLSVDHCHSTGKVRGLLCANCNRALGLFKENPEVLSSAISYLKGRQSSS